MANLSPMVLYTTPGVVASPITSNIKICEECNSKEGTQYGWNDGHIILCDECFESIFRK